MNNIIKTVLGFAILCSAGCKKYVEVKTQGSFVPQETINYRYILNDNGTFEGTDMLPDIASDDITIADSAQQANLAANSSYAYFMNAYTYSSPIYPNTTDNDLGWNKLYTIIFTSNVVINEVPSSTGGTVADKNQLLAEAKVHRADAYLSLINMYAKPYNASTAATDPGVPLVTTPTVTDDLSRASVEAVYNLITSDLTSVVKYLPKYPKYNVLPGQAAAYAILARANLLMGKYAQAGAWADSALAIQSTLNNLATLTAANYPKRLLDPEIILSKQAYQSFNFMPVALRLSDTLLNVLGTNDLRYTIFTTPASYFSATLYTGRFFYKEMSGSFETRNLGPTVPEMMLIKAEALARAGNFTDAMNMVNTLRQKRFTAANYTALTATSANDALIKVIKERQREFFCRGLRWFDMRRLKDDPLFTTTITRTFKGNTYSLQPSSNRYVFPIAEYYRSFHPNITQNP